MDAVMDEARSVAGLDLKKGRPTVSSANTF